jgi:hypothetical protein
LTGLNVRIAFLRVEATAGTSAHTTSGGNISYQMYLSREAFIYGLYFSHMCLLGLRNLPLIASKMHVHYTSVILV